MDHELYIQKRQSGKTTKIVELYQDLSKTKNVKIMVSYAGDRDKLRSFHNIPREDIILFRSIRSIDFRVDVMLIDDLLTMLENNRYQRDVLEIIQRIPRVISYSSFRFKNKAITEMIKDKYPEFLL